MTYLTRQEILDKVVEHFRAQGGPAVTKRHTCAYRAEDGKKCAVGVLIPDSFYTPAMEGRTAQTLARIFPDALRAAGVDPERDSDFLTSLQMVHDNAAITYYLCGNFMSTFMERMGYLAKREGLVIRSN
jgi:hypothetical protein